MLRKIRRSIIINYNAKDIGYGILLLAVFILFLVVSYNQLDATGLVRLDWTLGRNRNVPVRSSEESDDDFMERMKQRMSERRHILHENCKKLGLHHNRSKIREGLIYSDEYQTIFCQIPKTGITNWKRLFVDLMDIDIDFGHGFTGTYLKNYQVNGEKKNERLFNPDWLKMTVVREPLERLVSAYRSKLENVSTKLLKIAKRIQQLSADRKDPDYKDRKSPSFSTFINFLVNQHPDSIYVNNQHWMKYSEICQPCDFDYDVIGHQETIDEDSLYVLRLIGAPEKLSLKSAYRNKTDDDLVYRYYSTVRPRERVFQLYNLLLEDYILFGYPPPSVLDSLSKGQ